MRRVVNLSPDAASALLYLSRQRFRLSQNISLSEIRAGLAFAEPRLSSALSECVQSGWLLESREPRIEPSYSILSAGRRSAAWLAHKLH